MCSLLAALVLYPFEIEVSPQVAPLSRLLPEIGRRMDMKLVADASVRNDVMGIASPKRPVQVILDGIAEAANARWETRGDTLVLLRTKGMEAKEEETDAAHRAEWIRQVIAQTPIEEPFDDTKAAALANYRFEFKSKKDLTTADYAQLDVMNVRSPLGRLTRRLIEAIGPEELGKLPQGRRTVLSNRPTKVQRPLRVKDLPGLIETFRSEQNRYVKAVNALDKPSHTGQFVSGFDYVQEIPADPAKIIVVVDTTNSFQQFLYLQFLDSNRRTTASARCYVNRSFAMQSAPIEPDSPVIVLNETSKLRLRLSRQREAVSPADRVPFQDLIARDPLSYVHSEAIHTWSRHRSVPVFALLPDSAMFFGQGDPLRLGAYLNALRLNVTAIESADRIVIRPNEPALTRENRADRAALTAYIREVLKAGQATIAAQQRLALASPQPHGMRNTEFLRLALPQRNLAPYDLVLLRLFALGTPAQQAMLLNGGSLTVADMSREQANLAHDMVFGFSSEFGFGTRLVDGRDRSSPSELTERFPDGLPASLRLTATQTEQEGTQIKSDQGDSFMTSHGELFLNAEALASHQMLEPSFRPKEYRYARQRSLTLRFMFSETTGSEQAYSEMQVEPKSAWVAYESLPEELRALVNKFIEMWRSRRAPPPL